MMYDELVGQKFIFSGVTYFTVGLVSRIAGSWAILDQASWVAETGKLSDSLQNGTLEEVEVLGDGIWVNLETCTDLLPWKHDLPTSNS